MRKCGWIWVLLEKSEVILVPIEERLVATMVRLQENEPVFPSANEKETV